MPCLEKASLVTEYNACVQNYAATAAELARLRATTSSDKYQELLKSVEDARLKCEHARKALKAHSEKHGC